MRLFFLLLGLAVLFSCKKDQVEIQPTTEDITESVYASGIVKSKNQYQVFSTVSGIVKEILVEEGDSVHIGTPLMRIFNKTSILSERNAALAAEYAKLSANRQKLEDLRLAIDLARSKMKNDSMLLQRQQNLWAQNIGSRVELEQRELNYKNSVNNYRSAKIQYYDLERQLKLNADQSRNNLEISSTVADEYIIKSEVSGKVYDILKEKGELVNNQSPIALVGDDEEFLLELQVDEYDISRIKEKQKAFVTMDSYKGKVFEAIVTKINPVMNDRTKSFTVEANFLTSPPVLYPFLSVEANILIQSKKNALTIPREYLVDESFVLTKEKERKKVTTGLKDYERVEIVDGLTAQDVIVKPVQ
ncbi:HlyD family efflux transporter periplasmic adaptor subunit [Chryseolinea sp. H1M3-3]|uniref:efflux RND transporter periplasmic adaptor subunit n=1 Tax=Chryseolinea sp. H1M3-3 TaxID=3034144 RepID=UPI0023EB43AC|nr:HlyD family efflux transporter periplasmic adaptor subunit [Chryseolinea sp. H1M3-3]